MRGKRRYRYGGDILNILLYILLLLAAVLFNASESSAEGIYTVRKGDNLYSLSKKFRIEAERLIDVNDLDTIMLKPGMRLLIPTSEYVGKDENKDINPAGSKAAVKAAHKPVARVKKQDAGNYQNEADFHTVRKGETVSSIARKYSVSVSYLKGLNSLNSTSKIKIGQKIRLKSEGPKTYVVRKGDDMQRIARKFGLSMDELLELNELDSADTRVGQRLIVEEWNDASGNGYKPLSVASLSEEINELSGSPDLKSHSFGERSVMFAKKLLDIPYKFGGSSFMGIDCSAYVQKVYGFLNTQLPRTAREQFRVGEAVDKDELSVGDLVFFRTYASFPSHVGIYLGDNLFIHASSKDKKVTINSLNAPYYLKRFIGAKRIAPEEQEVIEDKKEEKKSSGSDG